MTLDVSKALKHRLVLLVGEEEILRRRALDELLQAAGLQKDDFDLQTFVADAVAPSEWIGAAGIVPFLADRRTVVIRNALRIDLDRVKESELEGLPASSLLILVADEEAGSEDRVQRLKTTVRRGLEKLVTKSGGFVATFEPDSKKSKEAVLSEAKNLGKAMSPAAADALVEMTGGSLSRALDELEKLVIFVGDAPQIRESDVRDIVVPSREWNVFKMVEAMLEGRVSEALNQLRILVTATAKAEDTAFRNILPTVSNQLRLVWQARLLLDAGKTPRDVPADLVGLFASKPNLMKEKDWRQNKVMSMARQASLDELDACFQILSDTDARLKGILNEFSAIETLEVMVLEMSGAMTAKPVVRR